MKELVHAKNYEIQTLVNRIPNNLLVIFETRSLTSTKLIFLGNIFENLKSNCNKCLKGYAMINSLSFKDIYWQNKETTKCLIFEH